MKTTSVAHLKAHLSRLLRLVKTGEEIVITERDVPIAKVVPIAQADGGLESLRDLERQGLLRIGSAEPLDLEKSARGKDPKGKARRALREERDRGW